MATTAADLTHHSLDLAAQQHPHLLRSASYNYPHRKAFSPCDAGSTDLGQQKLSISPLALMVNMPCQNQSQSELGREFLDTLIQEIGLHKSALGRRPVTQLLLRHPFCHYKGAEITELMHHLASSFRLSHRDQSPVEYCAELFPHEATPENMALLRGLGFNEFLLCLPTRVNSEQLELLKQGWQQAQLYNPGLLGIRLPYGYLEQDLHNLRTQLDFLLELKPQRLWLTPATELEHWNLSDSSTEHNSSSASQFAMVYSALRHAGYRVLGNDCFINGKDNLAVAQNQNRLRRTAVGYNSVNASDSLGLGPAAPSQLGRFYHSNTEQLELYRQSVNAGLYPVSQQLKLQDADKASRVVIDQLLCYHRLDISYIENRYDIKLLALAENIAWELNAEANMELIRIHNGLLQLSDEGIMRLLFIGDIFLSRLRPQ